MQIALWSGSGKKGKMEIALTVYLLVLALSHPRTPTRPSTTPDNPAVKNSRNPYWGVSKIPLYYARVKQGTLKMLQIV